MVHTLAGAADVWFIRIRLSDLTGTEFVCDRNAMQDPGRGLPAPVRTGRGILRNADCEMLSTGNLRKIRCRFFLRNEGKVRNESIRNVTEMNIYEVLAIN